MGAFPTAPPSVIMHLRRSLWPHNVPYQRHPGLLVRASFASEWGEKKSLELCHQLLGSGFIMGGVVEGRWDAGWELGMRQSSENFFSRKRVGSGRPF